jgi:hypothetical protein
VGIPEIRYCKGIIKKNNDHQEHCPVCGRDGHKKEGCFKVIGYPDWWPEILKNEKAKSKVAHVDGEGSTVED